MYSRIDLNLDRAVYVVVVLYLEHFVMIMRGMNKQGG